MWHLSTPLLERSMHDQCHVLKLLKHLIPGLYWKIIIKHEINQDMGQQWLFWNYLKICFKGKLQNVQRVIKLCDLL